MRSGLHPCGRQDAYAALRAALQTLRDHLPVGGVLGLSAQLPMLLRGIYLEDWAGPNPETVDRGLDGFCAELESRLPDGFGWSGGETARAAFAVLSEHVAEGEPRKLVRQLPSHQRVLWPQALWVI